MSTPRPQDLTIELVPLAELEHWPGNARRGITPQIIESMKHNGVFNPLVVQKSTRRIIIGNHRYDALTALHAEDPETWGDTAPVIFLDVNDSRATRINIADNKTSDDAEWDKKALADQLAALLEEEEGVLGTGFDEWEVDQLATDLDQLDDQAQAALDDADESNDGRQDETDRGSLLAITDVTFAEPTAETAHGQVWRLGKHTLVIRRLKDEHEHWRDYLEDGVIFAPYPDPFITATYAGMHNPLLLIQPNLFLAAHTIDKFRSIFPGETVEKVDTDA